MALLEEALSLRVFKEVEKNLEISKVALGGSEWWGANRLSACFKDTGAGRFYGAQFGLLSWLPLSVQSYASHHPFQSQVPLTGGQPARAEAAGSAPAKSTRGRT